MHAGVLSSAETGSHVSARWRSASYWPAAQVSRDTCSLRPRSARKFVASYRRALLATEAGYSSFAPKWRNWQTRRTQNPVRRKPRVRNAGEPMVPQRALLLAQKRFRSKRGLRLNGVTLGLAPKWRNWQTRRTQNPVRRKPRVGSTPTFGTRLLEFNFLFWPAIVAVPRLCRMRWRPREQGIRLQTPDRHRRRRRGFHQSPSAPSTSSSVAAE